MSTPRKGQTKDTSGTPRLGLDIDGTIDENPRFFELLSHYWPGEVFVITYRDNEEGTRRDLADFNIYYDKLIMVDDLDKSAVLVKNGIDVYIDDQDECIQNTPNSITIMKIRNEGNFEGNKWLYSSKTGKQL